MTRVKVAAILTALLTVVLWVPGPAQQSHRELSVVKALPAGPDADPGEHVLLLLDRRLSPKLQAEIWNNGDWSYVLPPNSSEYKAFSSAPPADARLELRREDGTVVEERDLSHPLARIEPWNSKAPGSVFLVTVDLSAGAGSYSGPETEIVEVSGERFRDAEAADTSGKIAPIHLVKSLKSDWRILSRGTTAQILSVACHPGAHGKFVMDYARYSLAAGKWTRRVRQTPGMWESDQAFPPTSAFPPAGS